MRTFASHCFNARNGERRIRDRVRESAKRSVEEIPPASALSDSLKLPELR